MEQAGRIIIKISCSEDIAIDASQSYCLLRQKPDELLSLWINQKEKLSFCFLIDGKNYISLNQLPEELTQDQALQILLALARAAHTASDYLLTVDLKLLRPELIFLKQDDYKEIRIISLPLPEKSKLEIWINEQILPAKNDLASWLKSINVWPAETMEEIASLLTRKSWPELSSYLQDLIKLKESEQANAAALLAMSSSNPAGRKKKSKAGKVKGKFRQKDKKAEEEKAGIAGKIKVRGLKEKFVDWARWLGLYQAEDHSLEFSDLEPTENLVSRMPNYRLAMLSEGLPGTEREEEGQRAFILVDEFIIGRDSRIADLFLTSAAVGRRHARILRRGENFFLEDLGSINNTLLDGRRIEKFRETLLPDRCRLSFADKSFYFSTD